MICVVADEEAREAQVIVPDNQLSLAIGKEGQNARLSAKLTGFKIDIKSETQAKEMGLLDEIGLLYETDEDGFVGYEEGYGYEEGREGLYEENYGEVYQEDSQDDDQNDYQTDYQDDIIPE